MTIAEWDAAVFKLINGGLGCPTLDPVMLFFTALGLGTVQVGASLFLILFGLLCERLNLRLAGYAGLIAFVLSSLASQIGKYIWARPRPPLALFDIRMVDVNRFVHSFPSGHTCTAFAAAVAFSMLLPRIGWVLIPVAALVGVSRVYLGVHFPLDVIYGALVGTLLGILSASIVRRNKKSSK